MEALNQRLVKQAGMFRNTAEDVGFVGVGDSLLMEEWHGWGCRAGRRLRDFVGGGVTDVQGHGPQVEYAGLKCGRGWSLELIHGRGGKYGS